jgi:DNA-binding phage protein
VKLKEAKAAWSERPAREQGMSKVAGETALARESLYRSLDAAGNPEFATVIKVLSSIGLKLEAKAIQCGTEDPTPMVVPAE